MKRHLLIFSMLLVCLTAVADQPRRPNVLMICIDDLNDWVGCMGGHPNTKTPNIDRLAAQGTLFLNAHCPAPLCGPARAAILSGLTPATTGIYGHILDSDLKKSKAEDSVFLSNWFSDHGYRTMGRGKIFHENAPDGAFQELFKWQTSAYGPRPEKYFHWKQPGTVTDWGAYPERDEQMPDFQTAKWAAERLRRSSDQPFFLAVGFVRPHVPWYVPQEWFDLHPLESIELPPYRKGDQDDVPLIARRVAEMPQMPTTEWALESGQWKNIVQAYLACVSFVDHCVGQVLDALEEGGHASDTVVVLWSDHGYHLGEKNRFAKQSLWERSTRVPLIIAKPGLPQGQTSPRPVSLMDVYPTLLELCDLPANPKNEGVSLVPLLKNPSAKWERAAITTYGERNHAVRTGRYRYIRYEDASEELYDLQEDPHEWANLSDKPGYEDVKQRLSQSLPKTNAPWSPYTFNPCNKYFTEKTTAGYRGDRQEE
jgi:arylsulfatase A-like enzyme